MRCRRPEPNDADDPDLENDDEDLFDDEEAGDSDFDDEEEEWD